MICLSLFATKLDKCRFVTAGGVISPLDYHWKRVIVGRDYGWENYFVALAMFKLGTLQMFKEFGL